MEPRKNTLKYAVFKYLVKNEKECTNEKKYSIINYEDISEKRDCANSSYEIFEDFQTDYKNQNKILNKTLKVFGIEDSNIMYDAKSQSKNQYDLNDYEVDFISELLFKLNHDDIWKKIRKVDNRNYDGFVQLYRKTADREKLISETKFAIDGFLKICERKYSKNSEKYKNFFDQLYLFSQYNRLIWMKETESILFNALPINKEDVENSKAGVLLNDYQSYLDKTTSEIQKIINVQNAKWKIIKEKYKQDLFEMDFNDNSKLALDHWVENIYKHDKSIGEYFEKLFNNIEIEKDDNLNEFRKKQSLLKKSFVELSDEDKNELCKIIPEEFAIFN